MFFNRILVANRGEIACRIFRTARELGIETVGIYAANDATAYHRNFSDLSILLEERNLASAYLDIEQIVEIAIKNKVEAIHPGYGFLSERAEFALATKEAGMKFIGPDSSIIELMGKKDTARSVAELAGVPVVPYFESNHGKPNVLEADLPIMIKSVSGGGGKGMRIVRELNELEENIQAAKRESLKAFGDDTLLFEKYIENGRHIEVQVLCDAHGNRIHLFDRECSAQRRHQKIIEEAPAPNIPDDIKELLFETSLELCKQVNYENAGTLEFIFDGQNAYFLEMNTRIQVEHCVTEMITGIDIVEQQLRIASGNPLEITQNQVKSNGHSIEARVYAEDPYKNFLPQTGIASFVAWPNEIRCEVAIMTGNIISENYDPMVAKIISHGQDRLAAIGKLKDGLAVTAIEGFNHNLGFLYSVLSREDFKNSKLATSTLDSEEFAIEDVIENYAILIAGHFQMGIYVNIESSWRIGQTTAAVKLMLYGNEATYTFGLNKSGLLSYENNEYFIAGERDFGLPALFTIDNVQVPAIVNGYATYMTVHIAGNCFTFYFRDRRKAAEPQGINSGKIKAIMPGLVAQLKVKKGDSVVLNQLLAVMEAMKMETRILSPISGTVTELNVDEGQHVTAGFELMQISQEIQER